MGFDYLLAASFAGTTVKAPIPIASAAASVRTATTSPLATNSAVTTPIQTANASIIPIMNFRYSAISRNSRHERTDQCIALSMGRMVINAPPNA